MKMRLCQFVLFMLLIVVHQSYGNDEWQLVTNIDDLSVPVNQDSEVGNGDKAYMASVGESLYQIALQHTGDENNWQTIARYNRLNGASKVEKNGMILIPEKLLLDTQSPEKYEFQEYNTNTVNSTVDQQVALASVKTINVDLFVGQVKVLGQVSVTRVAVGNGSIVRAEVLKSGELLVIGQSVGSTSVRLWHKDGHQSDYNLRVSEHDPETRFPMERMVRMKVKMVEFRKNALGMLGINWGDSISGPVLAITGDVVGGNFQRPTTGGLASLSRKVEPFSTYFGIASNIKSQINFLASRGDAVTLAEPVLSCANGGSASFLAGGEVPYPTTGTNGDTKIAFKDYGIKLNISPEIDPSGNVRASIETEISQIDLALSIDGTPGLLTRRAQTQVNVRSGETIVISGLLSSESSTELDKVPGLGKLPFLGHLFRSKNTRNSVSELVIFVTPEVIETDETKLSTRQAQIEAFAQSERQRTTNSLPILD